MVFIRVSISSCSRTSTSMRCMSATSSFILSPDTRTGAQRPATPLVINPRGRDIQPAMKRLRILRRWFKRRFGYARLLCVGLLIGFAALRVADPAPIEEFRVRTFDTFQVIDPRVKTAKPVRIVNIDEKSLAKFGQWPC